MEPYQLGRTANPYFWKLWYPSSWCLSSLVLAQTAEQYVLQIHLNIFVTLHTVISFFIFIYKILNFLLSQKWLGTWSQSVCPRFDWVFSPVRVWVPALWKKLSGLWFIPLGLTRYEQWLVSGWKFWWYIHCEKPIKKFKKKKKISPFPNT